MVPLVILPMVPLVANGFIGLPLVIMVLMIIIFPDDNFSSVQYLFSICLSIKLQYAYAIEFIFTAVKMAFSEENFSYFR